MYGESTFPYASRYCLLYRSCDGWSGCVAVTVSSVMKFTACLKSFMVRCPCCRYARKRWLDPECRVFFLKSYCGLLLVRSRIAFLSSCSSSAVVPLKALRVVPLFGFGVRGLFVIGLSVVIGVVCCDFYLVVQIRFRLWSVKGGLGLLLSFKYDLEGVIRVVLV